MYLNVYIQDKSMSAGTYITLNAYIRKKLESSVDNLNAPLKNPEKKGHNFANQNRSYKMITKTIKFKREKQNNELVIWIII